MRTDPPAVSRRARAVPSVLLPCLVLVACASGPDSAHEAGASAGEAPAPTRESAAEAREDASAVEPKPERDAGEVLVARADARWGFIEEEAWERVYPFLTPEWRESQSLPEFVRNAEHHHYVVTARPSLLALDGDAGYVEVTVDWTPTHPEIVEAPNYEEFDFPDEIEMVETWERVGGTWFHAIGERRDAFRAERPDLFR